MTRVQRLRPWGMLLPGRAADLLGLAAGPRAVIGAAPSAGIAADAENAEKRRGPQRGSESVDE